MSKRKQITVDPFANGIDERLLEQYREEMNSAVANPEPRPDGQHVIESCPLPRPVSTDPLENLLAAADTGEWTPDGGCQWNSDRAALIERIRSERLARLGDHRALEVGE